MSQTAMRAVKIFSNWKSVRPRRSRGLLRCGISPPRRGLRCRHPALVSTVGVAQGERCQHERAIELGVVR
jgi:hypothetical protein